MPKDYDYFPFSAKTKKLALARQRNWCGSCGTLISQIGEAGKSSHKYNERSEAHHVQHAQQWGSNKLSNCVILCRSCHANAHEGSRFGSDDIHASKADYPHFYGKHGPKESN